MFHHVDDALEALLRHDAPLLAGADISFDAHVEGAPPPALRMLLCRINLSAKGTSSGTEVIERDGVKVRRQRLPNIELTYAVTSAAPDARERHALLATAMRTFLRHAGVPAELLPQPLVDAGASVSLRVPKRDADDTAEAAAGPASIELRVLVPLDLDHEVVLADAPGSTDLGLSDQGGGAASQRRRYAGEALDAAARGADVLGPGGAATIDQDGRFVITARPGDRLAVMVDPPLTVVVPESGKIVVD